VYFDTHAHYDDAAFDPDREALLAGLPHRGIELVVNPGCNLASSRKAVEYAQRFPHVYAAVGFHPSDAADFGPDELEALRELAQSPKVVAVGEVGLDYYWEDYAPREVQQQVLSAQFELARALDLPVIFHDREAHADSVAMARRYPDVRGVFHCYSGSLEDAKVLVKLGWMLSFTGSITFKNARKAPEVIQWLPLERIMIETDSPYLAPVPHRGERNDSGNVPLVAAKIAELKGLTTEEVARATLENGKRFFRISC
jgi:TatD DNase family protein